MCGESLGSGVVAGIVASHEVSVKGLLLITPFDSMTKVAQHHYWFFLARWLLLDKFDNVPRLRDFPGHIAVLLAEQDEGDTETGGQWLCRMVYRNKNSGVLKTRGIIHYLWNPGVRGGRKRCSL